MINKASMIEFWEKELHKYNCWKEELLNRVDKTPKQIKEFESNYYFCDRAIKRCERLLQQAMNLKEMN